MIWTFHQAGHIPGVPGDFANCRVDVADDGTYEVLPLLVPPHNAPDVVVPQDVAPTPEAVQDPVAAPTKRQPKIEEA